MSNKVFSLASDPEKKPVNLADVKPGTKLKVVLGGQERTVVKGKFVEGGHIVDEQPMKDAEDAARAAMKAAAAATKAKLAAARAKKK